MLISLGLCLLTLLSFIIGLHLFRKSGQFPLLHPLVISSVMIAFSLKELGVNFERFEQANQIFYQLLGPATVALAIPLYQQFHRVKEATSPILITLLLGAFITPACGVAITAAFAGDNEVIKAMLTKAVTTPIALSVAENSTHAHPGLVAGIVVFSGVVGAIFASPLFKLLKISDPRVQGLALGVNAHAAGTTRGFELSQTCGAFSSLALVLTGFLTAFLLPLIALFF